MSLPRTASPDPAFSANIYCAGHLDDLISRAILPFRDRLRELDLAAYLWLMRYARRGEHLKVRVYCRQETIEPAREALGQLVEEALADIEPLAEDAERISRFDAEPIDAEDRGSEEQPDRTILWTSYGASHVSLGGEPFLADDQYRDHMGRCLAMACDRVLDAFRARDGVVTSGQRQQLLLQALIPGLATLGWERDKAADYLAFHRDWLIRFPLLKSGGEEAQAGTVMERFTMRSAKMAGMVKVLGGMVEQWRSLESGSFDLYPDSDVPWCKALTELHEYLAAFRDDPDYRTDPFATDVVFPPLFKVFNGLANHLGMRGLDESFAHHLLLQAVAEDPSVYGRISLTPA